MGKYDAALDLETRNSLSLILAHVSPGIRILEFGCASGRLTRYLHEELGAKVDIVELDEASGSVAAAWADVACLGAEQGNIDAGLWKQRLEGKQYDCVVFADVLEHLRFPGAALRDCRDLLAPGGKILVSVPNIAHNAIILGLMNNIFNYTSLGLLDNTHIHFFTRRSFREMAENLGYMVVAEEANSTPVGRIEVQTTYDMVPRSAARALRCRPDGDVYQWIFVLQSQKDDLDGQVCFDVPQQPPYVCECYVQKRGETVFSEASKLVLPLAGITSNGFRKRAIFDIRMFQDTGLAALRLDPLDAPCLIRLHEFMLVDDNGESHEIKEWHGNGVGSENFWAFPTDDPQMEIKLEADKGYTQLICDYEVIAFDDDAIASYAELMDQSYYDIGRYKREAADWRNRAEALQDRLNDLEKQFEEMQEKLNSEGYMKKAVKNFFRI